MSDAETLKCTADFRYTHMLGCQYTCSVWDSFDTYQCFFHCRIISLQTRLGISWLACMLHHLQLYLTACITLSVFGNSSITFNSIGPCKSMSVLINSDILLPLTALCSVWTLTECQAKTVARRRGFDDSAKRCTEVLSEHSCWFHVPIPA